jgi:hypothetical protein
MCVSECVYVYLWVASKVLSLLWPVVNILSFFLVECVVAQWLRHCATSQKVTGSIPDGVTGTFH